MLTLFDMRRSVGHRYTLFEKLKKITFIYLFKFKYLMK